MKKLFFLLSFLMTISIFPQQQEKFIIGAEHVSSVGELFGYQLPHSPTFWNYVTDFNEI